ncbi:MAG: ABC transporter permease [Gemmataceae bacterium]|nr:ABC transporter permease [Gemmataceae bacterium]
MTRAVNGQHLRAFFWLQWRLRVNQLKKGGAANAILLAIVAGAAVLLALILFVVFFLVGWLSMADAEPLVHLIVWDALVAAFIFFWMIGLVTQLQRAEALALEKFLHLPVSLAGVFVLNYLSSLLSFSLIVFGPAMLGLALGSVARGPAHLATLPLLAAFLLMVTALTYQFRGWLASLMVNKRRRRTIIVVVTTIFILLIQLPNLWNLTRSRNTHRQDELSQQRAKEQAEIDRALQARELTPQQYNERRTELTRAYQEKRRVQREERWRDAERIMRIINLCVPPGWLPLGAAAASEGNPLPGLLGTLGLALIGTASLWRAYRTTVRFHTGSFTAGKQLRPEATPIPAAAANDHAPGTARPAAAGLLLEKKLPWISEQAAIVALAGFRGLLRAPEVKLLLLSPIIMAVVFGAVILRSEMTPPLLVRPLIAVGALSMMLLTMVQLVGNQFGYDRAGFKIFVLSPARRGDILIGKNLAVAPMALGMGALAVVFVQAAYPMRLDHFAAAFPQMITLYLLFCLAANCLSILAPMQVAAGTLKPSHAKMVPVLLHFALLLLLPIVIGPALVPLGLEALVEWQGWATGLPICLALSLLECVGIVYFYRWLAGWQGVWLQSRELKILEVVTAKAE